jgi:SAM-dependent methyltransferase
MTLKPDTGDFHFSHSGWCPVCECETKFLAERPQFRDHLLCEHCKSIPRQRALVHVMSQTFPNWRELSIHEAGPAPWLSITQKLRAQCPLYTESQYNPTLPFGVIQPPNKWDPPTGVRNEDLEKQTFGDEAFDLVLTQDVFEHIFLPDRAISEIARTLKPRGAHICSVPLTQRHRPSQRRASLVSGQVVHHREAAYHANPVSKNGSLVTIDWGYDIVAYFSQNSGMNVTIFQIDNIELGIRAELIEILVCRKEKAPNL